MSMMTGADVWNWLGLGALGADVQAAVGYSIIAVALVGFLHNLSVAVWAASNLGPLGALGNREDLPLESRWGGRARRGLHNYVENTLLFGLLIVAALVFEIDHAALGAGAVVYAVARTAYLPVYLLGVPVLRTLIWMVSVFGLALMIFSLFAPSPTHLTP